ncbi:MAG: hypothetical protein JW395_4087 [Nitrospira sp.]|nr:hypothetical protein [Nitrospira sp.]
MPLQLLLRTFRGAMATSCGYEDLRRCLQKRLQVCLHLFLRIRKKVVSPYLC